MFVIEVSSFYLWNFFYFFHRGYQFIKDHLRMQDVRCYWKKLLKNYAKLIQWKPKRNSAFQEIKP